MNKQEFCELTGLEYHNISEDNFNVINTVYAYHPVISDVHGKEEIAALYKKGGMGIIRDLLATASEIAEAESRIQQNNVLLENLESEQKKEMDFVIQRQRDAVQDIKSDTYAACNRIAEINETYKK
jgi:hypothetical protein